MALSLTCIAKYKMDMLQSHEKNIPTKLREWLAEMSPRHGAFLGWAAEHFEGDSQNLAGMF